MPVDILDGAMGTELVLRGVDLEGAAWSARALQVAPHAIEDIHREYAKAGATVHTANTFRTQPRYGAGWDEAARLAVSLARDAVPASHRVAGSLAPIVDCYRPDLSPGEGARPEHRAVAEVLADAGCDVLLCETFAAEEEALVAVEEALRTGKETWLSLTGGPAANLQQPAEVAAVAERAAELGAARVLVNCTAATLIGPYVDSLSELGLAFGVYANAGRPEEGIGWGAVRSDGPARYAELAETWARAGASVIGGCCGTGPAHIRATVERLVDS